MSIDTEMCSERFGAAPGIRGLRQGFATLMQRAVILGQKWVFTLPLAGS